MKDNISIVTVDLMMDHYNICNKFFIGNDIIGLYSAHPDIVHFLNKTHRTPSAWIPTSTTWDQLFEKRSGRTGKKVREEYHKAERNGYYCKLFNPRDYCKDIYEINHSKVERQGIPMEVWYQKSVEELLDYFSWYGFSECLFHFRIWFGVFTKEGKLIGYIALTRIGEIGIYTAILGHSDYFKDNVILFLHFQLQKLLRESDDEHFKGIIGTSYYLWHTRYSSLHFWKQKVGFLPYRLELKRILTVESQRRPHP